MFTASVKSYLTVLLLALTMALLAGCGGGTGGGSPVINDQQTGTGTELSEHSTAGLLAVRMQPQAPREFPDKSMSWLAPQALGALLPPPRQLSWTDADLVKAASDFEDALPANRVNRLAAPAATFMPDWDPAGSPGAAGLAYAMYRFSLADYDQEPSQTMSFAWSIPPADSELFWVGFGNQAEDAWDWYAGPADGVLTIASYAPYLAGDGSVLVALAVLGTADCVLERLAVGDTELRGIGDLVMAADPDPFPPIEGSSPPASVDLSPDCSPINDQGQIGSCTAFAVGDGAYNYELGQLYANDSWSFDNDFNLVSPRYLYLETGKAQGQGSPYGGRYTGQVVSWLRDNGVATEHNAPYGDRVPGPDWCDDDWSADALADAALLDIEGWQEVNCDSGDGLMSIKAVLANQHRVVVMRTNLDAAFVQVESDEVWHYTGPSIGGHAMCIVGYDDSLQAFKVRNSWGGDWPAGDGGGHVWIAYNTFLNTAAAVRCWYLWDEYDGNVAARFCYPVPVLHPPSEVMASHDQSEYIEVSWSASTGATGYDIYRDTQDNLVGSTGIATEWSDWGVEDFLSHCYWVVATGTGDDSVYSAPALGFRGQAPEVHSVTPLSAYCNQEVTFSAVVTGSGPLTYSWDFGGGTTPNTSSGASPVVTAGDPGDYSCTLYVENAFGSDTFPFQFTSQSNQGNWWCWGHDRLSTHRSEYAGTQTNNVKWTYTTGDTVQSSPAISADGTIYVGSNDNNIYAINPDGSLKWSYPTGDEVHSSPAIGTDGTVYVGSWDGKLYAVHPDGTLRWSYTTGDDISSSPAIGTDGTIYVGSIDDSLYAINPDGTLLWSFATDNNIYSAPVIDADGTVYVGSGDYSLYAIYPDGTLKWSYATLGILFFSPAIGPDGTIYVGSNDFRLYAINPDGTLKWLDSTGIYMHASPAIGSDGTVYVGSGDHNLYAYNPDGTIDWAFSTDGNVYSSPAIGSDGTLYVGSSDHNFYAVNPDGSLKWSYATGGLVTSSPAIGAGGMVYVGSVDNKLYAFGPEPVYIMPDPADTDWEGVTGSGTEEDCYVMRTSEFNPDYELEFSLVANTEPDGSGTAIPVESLDWSSIPPFACDWVSPGVFKANQFTNGYLWAETEAPVVTSNVIWVVSQYLP